MATNPRTWIYGLIDAVPGVLAAPARYIADRVFSVFDDGVEFAVWLKSGFAHLRTYGEAFALRVRETFGEAYATFKWLVDIRIPALIASAESRFRSWATGVINSAVNGVRGTLTALDKWAKAAVSAVTTKLDQARDWLLGKINALDDKLRRTVDTWYERLTDPRKLAAWAIGAILLAALNYLYANRDKLARWLLESSPAFTEWFAKQLDAVLRRLL